VGEALGQILILGEIQTPSLALVRNINIEIFSGKNPKQELKKKYYKKEASTNFEPFLHSSKCLVFCSVKRVFSSGTQLTSPSQEQSHNVQYA